MPSNLVGTSRPGRIFESKWDEVVAVRRKFNGADHLLLAKKTASRQVGMMRRPTKGQR